MQQFSFDPVGIFSLKDTKAKKIHKIRKPSGLSMNPLFEKECHLLSDTLKSMEICLRVNDTLIFEISLFSKVFDLFLTNVIFACGQILILLIIIKKLTTTFDVLDKSDKKQVCNAEDNKIDQVCILFIKNNIYHIFQINYNSFLIY